MKSGVHLCSRPVAASATYAGIMIHIQVGVKGSSEIREILEFWANHAENSSRAMESHDALIALIARDPDALILAIENDEIVGTVLAGWNGWRCTLYRLAVREDKRKQGIGKLLVDSTIERFKSFSGTRIDAMILNENETAHMAWAAYEFEPQENWSRWVRTI